MVEARPDKISPPPETPVAYSIEGAMEATGLSRSKLYLAIKSRDLIARKLGKRTIILHNDLMAFLEALPVMQTEAA